MIPLIVLLSVSAPFPSPHGSLHDSALSVGLGRLLRQSPPIRQQTRYISRRVPDASASCSSVSAWGVWRIQSPCAASPSFSCCSYTPAGCRSRFPRFPISSHGKFGSSGVSVPRQKPLQRVAKLLRQVSHVVRQPSYLVVEAIDLCRIAHDIPERIKIVVECPLQIGRAFHFFPHPEMSVVCISIAFSWLFSSFSALLV